MSANQKSAPFADRVENYRARVEQTLDDWLQRSALAHTQLAEAMRYTTLGGGKRTRPLLVYASGELNGVDLAQCDAIAAAIEMIHTYSLVHDDLPAMDDDALRRGQPTVHIAYDEATAILVGDALLTLAFQVLAEADAFAAVPEVRAQLISVLAQASGGQGMVGGQAMDLSFEQQQPSQALLEDMFSRKTGALIKAAIVMPAVCNAQIPDAQRDALAKFADCAGLSFQIQDDILEVTSDTVTLGKDQGSDARNDKAAYPSLFGLEHAQRRAQGLAEEAAAQLDALGPASEGLAWLSDFIVNRKH